MRHKSINKALDNWLSELKYGREYETLRCIRVNINRLIQYFDDDLSLITFETYHNWLKWASNKWKASTVHKTHKTAKRLIKRLNLKDAKKISNIISKLQMEKIETYSREEIGIILEWSYNQNCHSWRSRCAAFLLIVSSSGMRGGEAVSLKWEDFDEKAALFHLKNTKTKASRFAAIHPKIIPYLIQYRQRINQRINYDSPHVFPSFINPGNAVQYTAVMNAIREEVSQELKIKINAKKFRSTLVKFVIESGAGYERAAAIVGHQDIGTTQRHYHRISLNQDALTAHAVALEGLGFDNISK